MYESFFQLTGRPFAAAPNRHQYFAAGAIEHARKTLARCIARAEGPATLIGPAGTGKTLLCQLLADDFDGQLDCIPLASGNLGTARSLLQVLLHELDMPYRGLDEGELRLALIDRVVRQRNVHGILLMVDEAHVLPARLLEELRLLTNLVREGQQQVRLILSGSAELEERFASPKLESFSQRIAARCYLEAFHRDETRAYLTARIAACGPEANRIFTADAIDQIHLATEGVPRLINQLADHALVLACAAGIRPLDGRVIAEAWSDLQQLPTPWNQANHVIVGSDAGSDADTIEFGALDDEPWPAVERLPARQASDDEPATVPWPHFAGSIELAEPASSIEPAPQERASTPFQFPASSIAEDLEFLEEEVVLDPYATLDAQNSLIRHRVATLEGRELWAQLAPHAAAAARQNVRLASEPEEAASAPCVEQHTAPAANSRSPAAETPPTRHGDRPLDASPPPVAAPAINLPAAETPTVDDDLIVIEDDGEPLELIAAPGFGRVRKQEYKQLFKKLRNA